MRPLSNYIPKPCLPVLGKPLLLWAVEQAASAGVEVVVVNAWHLAEHVISVLRKADAPCQIKVSVEGKLMGTAGGIRLALERGLLDPSKPLLQLNADALYKLDLKALFEAYEGGDWEAVMAVLPHLDPLRWSRVCIDEEMRVVAVVPPGKGGCGGMGLLYPGVQVIGPELLSQLPSGRSEIPDVVWRPAMARGKLGVSVVSGHWREVGTPEAYIEAVSHLAGPDGWVSGAAKVGSDVFLGGSAVEEGASVGSGSWLSATVVMAGARVGCGVKLSRCVVLPGARVNDGVEASGVAFLPNGSRWKLGTDGR